MAAQQSMWRVNDVVAYDVMRELSADLQARLLDRIRNGDNSARTELLEIRHATIAVDGYDRSAVEAFTQQVQGRDTELAQAHQVPPDPAAPLTPNETDEIYRSVIQPTLFDGSPGGESAPTLVLLGGQPGSGKSRASARLLAEHDGMVALSGDDLRIFHPHYRHLVTTQPELAGAVLADATSSWVRDVIHDSLDGRRSLLLDGMFGDPDVTLATAAQFRETGFRVRIVAIASPRVLSVVTAASRYLRDRKLGSPARLTRLSVHTRGYDGTTRLIGSLDASAPVDQVTIVSRNGNILFDRTGDNETESGAFDGAPAAMRDGRHPTFWGARSTMELLGELKQIAAYATSSGHLTADTAELLIEAHELALTEVAPNLSVAPESPQARFIHQAVSEQLVALRREAAPAQQATTDLIPQHDIPSTNLGVE